MLRCSDQSLYTGVTKDVPRRLHEHNNTKKGAKYTRSRRPCMLVYVSGSCNRSEAQKREYKIKKMPKRLKEVLVADNYDVNISLDSPTSG